MESILILCDKSPFGTNLTAEAIRITSGFLGLGPTIDCNLVFDEDAVYFLSKEINVDKLNVDTLEEPLELLDLVDAKVFVVKKALEERGMSKSDLVDDLAIELIDESQLAEMIAQSPSSFRM
ncbi:MAG: DsrE family protein [Candidatus Thorarchaeota archaeon]